MRPGRERSGSSVGGNGPGGSAGARGAALLAVAVILGIVLLQKFDTSPIASGPLGGAATSTTRRVGLTTLATVTTTTAKTRAKADVKVLVANGAGIRGLGAATTNALKNVGYATLTPADTTATVEKTQVQFADGYEAEAREVAQAVSLPATAVVRLSSPPVAAADLGDAKVVVVLGTDVSATSTSSTTTTIRR